MSSVITQKLRKNMQSETKTCQNCKQDFVIEPDDFNFYEKIKVPSPTWCPECRMKRRMTFRNERLLFRRKCALCGKDIITMYHPEADVVVYCNECWWSDKWDAEEYGMEYDFNIPFFTQLARLLKKVPRMALEAYQNEYSPYSNYTWISKNIYMSPSTMYSENIFYSQGITRSQDSIDCIYILDCQLLYECQDCQRCVNSISLTDCRECLDCSFLYDCRGCKNCFMSSNLRNKSYVFRNEQLSKEEYEQKIKEVQFGNRQVFNACIAEHEQMREKAIHRFASLFKTTMSTGNNLINSKNAKNCFTGEDLENVRYAIRVFEIKDSADLYGVGNGAEMMYEGTNIGYKDSLIRFSTNTFEDIRDATYCDYCRTSQNIFGCVGLRRKQFCILNKQYIKEEYLELVKKIEQHMKDMPYKDANGRTYSFGEFFPPELSPFSYNESVAQEFYSRTEQEALTFGAGWRSQTIRNYQITKHQIDLPDDINKVDDSITEETIECLHKGSCDEQCTSAFKILDSELQFYRKMNLPLPQLCPNCRHYQRIKYRNPMNVKLWDRACSKCGQDIKTPYAHNRPEIVYCEQCYNAEVA